MLIILNIIYCSYKSNSNIGNTLFIFINFAILNISTRSSLVRYFVCQNCLLTIKIHFVAAGGHSILPGIQSHIAFEIFYSSWKEWMSVTRLLISQELRQEVLLCSVFALLLKKCYLYVFLRDCMYNSHILWWCYSWWNDVSCWTVPCWSDASYSDYWSLQTSHGWYAGDSQGSNQCSSWCWKQRGNVEDRQELCGDKICASLVSYFLSIFF